MIDDADFEWANQYVWYVLKQTEHNLYFIRKVFENGAWTSRRLHRELLVPSTTEMVVDHKDKITLNNCRGNLRLITQHQNSMNSRAEKESKTSKFRGVDWDKSRGKWRAQITFKFRNKFLGRFKDENEAALAYNTAAKTMFGDFAQLNEVKYEKT